MQRETARDEHAAADHALQLPEAVPTAGTGVITAHDMECEEPQA
ncbi:MAG: hypothetical protein ABFD98_18345 [Syntrophobacteraceae bacterium]